MARKPKSLQPPPRTIYLGEWLTRLGISVNDAAKAGGVGQSYISNMIAGRKDRPETSIMLGISELLGITVNDLYKRPPPQSTVDGLGELSPSARAALFRRPSPKS